MRLRLATPDDLAVVESILSRAFPRLLKSSYPASVIVLAVPLISRARPELLRSGSYYLAEDEAGCPIACGGWSRSPADLAHARHFATDPDATRRGAGKAILLHVLERAAAAGCRRIEALATRNAVPFYAAAGFSAVGEVNVPLRPGIDFPAVRMIRALD